VNEIPVALGARDAKVTFEICVVLLATIKSFVGVFGINVTDDEENPTIEIPATLIASGPPLLSSK